MNIRYPLYEGVYRILTLFSGKLENFILSIGTFVKKAMRKIKKYLKGKRHPLIRK